MIEAIAAGSAVVSAGLSVLAWRWAIRARADAERAASAAVRAHGSAREVAGRFFASMTEVEARAASSLAAVERAEAKYRAAAYSAPLARPPLRKLTAYQLWSNEDIADARTDRDGFNLDDLDQDEEE